MLRNDFIKKYIEGKKVLDLGFLGSDKNEHDLSISELHEFISENSLEVIGVDFQESKIQILNNTPNKKAHYIFDDVRVLDNVKAWAIKKKYKWEVIVAGELIEHLENPGLFLTNIKELLGDNGIIIFTTPNYICLRNMKNFILTGREAGKWNNQKEEINYGHVVGFTPLLLNNLLARLHFDIIDFSYIFKKQEYSFSYRLEKKLTNFIPRFRPNLCYIMKPKQR